MLCTLVENLPDVKTESRKEADLPKALAEKWKKEGRYEQEVRELDEFFKRTGLPRYPRNYHIKWLVDFVEKYGIDGFRVDTAKHTEADLWAELEKYANIALNNWKKKHPEQVLDDNEFYMVGEVYGYNINNKLIFNYSDRAVDFFANGFKSLINFGFKYDSEGSYEELFAKYDKLLQQSLKGKSVLNYATSHDDGEPMDQLREKPYKVANMLLLAPGAAQIYYGDETNRSLVIDGTVGDATLRSFMNWEDLEVNNVLAGQPVRKVLAYWQKLGKFRASHPAVGAGNHKMLQEKPYVFGRTFKKGTFQDQVVIGLEMPKGKKSIPVGSFFANGTELTDMFSGKKAVVENGKIVLDTPGETVLLEK